MTPASGFNGEAASEMDCGIPKRAVPRVMISELRTRSSTGTRMGEGAGGAVRAAASAGDWILLPAIQLTTANRTTKNRESASLYFLSSLPSANCPIFSIVVLNPLSSWRIRAFKFSDFQKSFAKNFFIIHLQDSMLLY